MAEKRIFIVYQILAPLVLFPIAYLLWYQRVFQRHDLTILILSIPVISHYIIPAIGTNVTKLWEFHSKFLVGKFRPHHGFVFGTGMSFFAYVCVDRQSMGDLSVYEVLRTGLVTGSLFGFWNFIYDVFAIRSGYMTVYNRRWAEGACAEGVAMDYAPLYFGLFGALYGMEIKLIESLLLQPQNEGLYWWFLIGFNVVTTLLPVSVYMLFYYLRFGESGIWPHKR